jgi:hypothetical protein
LRGTLQLLHGLPLGTFLVRESESRQGEYSLSVSFGNVKHIKIIYHERQYRMAPDAPAFDSIQDLVEYYQRNTLERFFPGMATTLRFPYLTMKASIAGDEAQRTVYVNALMHMGNGYASRVATMTGAARLFWGLGVVCGCGSWLLQDDRHWPRTRTTRLSVGGCGGSRGKEGKRWELRGMWRRGKAHLRTPWAPLTDTAQNEDELTLTQGTELVLLSTEELDAGWWRGRLPDGKVGVVTVTWG